MSEMPENGQESGVIRQFRPHWRVLLAAVGWAVLAIGAIALVVATTEGNVRLVLAGLVVLGLLFVTTPDLVNYFSTRYTLTTDQIIVKHGVLKITKVKIPLESIDNITMTRNVLERMLGYGDMVIESTQGSSTFADIPDPEEFEAEVLRHRDLRQGRTPGGGGPSVGAPSGESVPRDAVQRLADLADLHDRGALTDAEFEAKKARLLDEI